jgi:hypothetical protein
MVRDAVCNRAAVKSNCHIFYAELSNVWQRPNRFHAPVARLHFILCAKDLRKLAIVLASAVGQRIPGV